MYSNKCPLCGFSHREPLVSTRTTPWGDCACSDLGPCVFHQIDPKDKPQRPSSDELVRRESEATAKRHKEWEVLMRRFEDFRAANAKAESSEPTRGGARNDPS